jgi:hypothetical protein
VPDGIDLKTILILAALLVVALTGAIVHTRQEWLALRHRLFRPLEGPLKQARPSRVAERLTSPLWDKAFWETLRRSRRDMEADGNGSAAALLGSAEKAGEDLSQLVKDLAMRAMAAGELRSALVRVDGGLIYALVFPGKHEDRRTFRRYDALADGWAAHATAVRARAVRDRQSPPLLGLLYILGLDAREGTLLVAYHGDDGRLSAAELVEPNVGVSDAQDAATLTYEFALA